MAEWNNQEPVRLQNFKEWVPDWLRIVLYLVFLVAFQFSNGFYFTTMAQLVGERNLTMSDTHMFGQTVLTGLCFYFPLAFRLKFRFTNMQSLIMTATGQMIVNLLFPHVHGYAAMLLLCYVGGFLRLYGTFECFSNLLPKITPTYNYAVFLSFVFFIVIGCVGVFDWLTMRIIYYFDWQHIHLLAVALCAMVIALVLMFMRPFRPMPKMPLYGIDLLGMLLWTIFILSAIFIFSYGHEYEWFHDRRIRLAAGFMCLALATCFLRMNHIRHSFIEYGAFRCPNLFNMLVLFLGADLMLSTQNVLQTVFTSSVLGCDQMAASVLKWPEFIGAAGAALFCWQMRTRFAWSLKRLTLCAFVAMLAYEVAMMQVMSGTVGLGHLWLPQFFLGFGHVSVFIALTVYAQAYCNFKYYFQVLCLLGFVRMGVGDVAGVALWEHALDAQMSLHLAAGSGTALLDSLRNLYAWASLLGVGMVMVILIGHFDSFRNPLPHLRGVYRIVKRRRLMEEEAQKVS